MHLVAAGKGLAQRQELGQNIDLNGGRARVVQARLVELTVDFGLERGQKRADLLGGAVFGQRRAEHGDAHHQQIDRVLGPGRPRLEAGDMPGQGQIDQAKLTRGGTIGQPVDVTHPVERPPRRQIERPDQRIVDLAVMPDPVEHKRAGETLQPFVLQIAEMPEPGKAVQFAAPAIMTDLCRERRNAMGVDKLAAEQIAAGGHLGHGVDIGGTEFAQRGGETVFAGIGPQPAQRRTGQPARDGAFQKARSGFTQYFRHRPIRPIKWSSPSHLVPGSGQD